MNKNLKVLLIALCLFSIQIPMKAQNGFVHEKSATYEWPTDPTTLEQLNKWQDLKFGVLFHWGLYSVPGIVESWSICSEDEDWIPRDSTIAYNDYKKEYWGLINKFNPTQFNPQQWSEVCKKAGMKYAIFTTKHHDGFNLFDTKQTDFSIMHGAFKNHPKANVAKYVFEAFRNDDFMVGAYYSKPDWHCSYYWWDRYATPTRNVNYKIEKHPQQWAKFQQFTYNQIAELMHDYGQIDILWLDGGWVAAPKQDIKMNDIASMARKAQPGILIVDRLIHGPNENYQTPERSIPEEQLPNPWESCIPLKDDWGWTPKQDFKSPEVILANLIEIVAKGGCLLLGVGPTPEGIIQKEVEEVLTEVGNWLKINGEAIYNTRTLPHYQYENIWFTQNPKLSKTYALFVPNKENAYPKEIEWKGNLPKGKLKLLSTGKNVAYKIKDNKVIVKLPKSVQRSNQALAFSYQTQ